MRTNLLGVLGALFGVVFAPLVFIGALIRKARLFHPDAIMFQGRVTACARDPRARRIAARLQGFVLARLSQSVNKGKEQPDWLGGGFRFRGSPDVTAVPGPGDQDLLVASLESLLHTGRAKKNTDWHDYLNNDYYPVAGYHVDGLGHAGVRIIGSRGGPQTGPRNQRLRDAAAAGQAHFRLEARPDGETAWLPVADIELTGPVTLDQSAWFMTPFRAGRGLTPTGFVHGLRLILYPVGRVARRLRGA